MDSAREYMRNPLIAIRSSSTACTSQIPTSPGDPGSHARLFACSTFDGHAIGNTDFKGRALFGIHKEGQGQIECRPILDDDAHEMAGRLGFLKRKPNDYGTSIMILGSTIGMDALRTAVEDYWWPRIYSNQLSVELWEDDEDISPPEPREREDLKPYIRCYSLIEEKMAPDEDEKVTRLQPASGSTAQQGQLALSRCPRRMRNPWTPWSRIRTLTAPWH